MHNIDTPFCPWCGQATGKEAPKTLGARSASSLDSYDPVFAKRVAVALVAFLILVAAIGVPVYLKQRSDQRVEDRTGLLGCQIAGYSREVCEDLVD